MIFTTRIFAGQICMQCLHLIREQTKTRTIHNLFNPTSRAKLTYSSKKVNLTTPLFLKAEEHPDRVAIVDTKGSYTYKDILTKTKGLTKTILQLCNERIHIGGSRVGILCPNDHTYVVAQWAVWRSGGVAVPLCKTHPPPEWEYFLEDSDSDLVITTDEFAEKLQPVASKTSTKLHVMEPDSICEDDDTEDSLDEHDWVNRINQLHGTNKYKHQPALIVYTSGTTGKPKGVVHTFGSLQAQMDDMVSAWEWSPQDVLLHVLPLHHVHGIINALMTPLYVGATCVMLPKFDAREVWSTLLTLSPLTPLLPRSINLFMAVPTVYAKLIEEYNSRYKTKSGVSSGQEFIKAVCSTKFRLMVSGSAALPQPIMMRWHEITGHMLLERYGMTELGMALTYPLYGPRIPGSVGQPFPGVEVCIGKPNVYADSGYDVIAQGTAKHTKETPGVEGEEGELYVKGPNVFKEYWRKPEATAASFTKDGWFKTGDTACYKDGAYKILGRTSVDIIKSGGYKISALDIERHLLSHEDITDVAVVGLPDMTWGQKVAAVVVLQEGKTLDLPELKKWAENKLPSYQVPSVVKVLTDMPRNAMGKVNKKELVKTVFPNEMKGFS